MASQLADLRDVVALLLAAAAIMGSPGPSTISVTAAGAAFGVRRSLRYAGGLIAGTCVVLLAVACGVAVLIAAVPQGAHAFAAVSAAYVLYLAFRIATAPPLQRDGAAVTAPAFAGGFLLAVANPKAYLAITAVFAASTLIRGAPVLDAVLKTALLGGMMVVIHLVWLVAGAWLSRLLHDPVPARVLNLSLAAVLVGVTALELLG